MRDTSCPPFLEGLSYLICIVLSYVMIGYLFLGLSLAGPQTVPLKALIFIIAFAVIIVYCFARLGRGLFTGGSMLMREIVEIDSGVK